MAINPSITIAVSLVKTVLQACTAWMGASGFEIFQQQKAARIATLQPSFEIRLTLNFTGFQSPITVDVEPDKHRFHPLPVDLHWPSIRQNCGRRQQQALDSDQPDGAPA